MIVSLGSKKEAIPGTLPKTSGNCHIGSQSVTLFAMTHFFFAAKQSHNFSFHKKSCRQIGTNVLSYMVR